MTDKRYLLDQALDHELSALEATLKHNLQVMGYPIEQDVSDLVYEQDSPF